MSPGLMVTPLNLPLKTWASYQPVRHTEESVAASSSVERVRQRDRRRHREVPDLVRRLRQVLLVEVDRLVLGAVPEVAVLAAHGPAVRCGAVEALDLRGLEVGAEPGQDRLVEAVQGLL